MKKTQIWVFNAFGLTRTTDGIAPWAGNSLGPSCRTTYLMSVGPQWYAKSASETEVRQLKIVVFIDKQILGLEIAV